MKEITKFSLQDAQFFSEAFKELGWDKPLAQFMQYLEEEKQGLRSNLIVKQNAHICGYVTILWESDHLYFFERQIPEIKDLNVLPKFRQQGCGALLLRTAEQEIEKRSALAGIGVGLIKDYVVAQRLYVKNGYLPNGEGATSYHKALEYGKTCKVDDDLILWMTKDLTIC